MTPILEAKQAFTKQVIIKLLFIVLVILAISEISLFALYGVPAALLLVVPLGVSGLIVATKIPYEVWRAIGYLALLTGLSLIVIGCLIAILVLTHQAGTTIIETFGLSRPKLLRRYGSASLILLSLIAVIWWRTKGFSAQA